MIFFNSLSNQRYFIILLRLSHCMASVILYRYPQLYRFAYVPERIELGDVLERLKRHGYVFVAGRTGVCDEAFTE